MEGSMAMLSVMLLGAKGAKTHLHVRKEDHRVPDILGKHIKPKSNQIAWNSAMDSGTVTLRVDLFGIVFEAIHMLRGCLSLARSLPRDVSVISRVDRWRSTWGCRRWSLAIRAQEIIRVLISVSSISLLITMGILCDNSVRRERSTHQRQFSDA